MWIGNGARAPMANSNKCVSQHTMAEGTNDFLREIDELLGEEAGEVNVKGELATKNSMGS